VNVTVETTADKRDIQRYQFTYSRGR